MSEIEVEIPLETVVADDSSIKSHFHSGIPHISDIVIFPVISVGHRQREEEEHVGCQPVKIFRRT